jgi:hypothetical protein
MSSILSISISTSFITKGTCLKTPSLGYALSLPCPEVVSMVGVALMASGVHATGGWGVLEQRQGGSVEGE